MQDYLLVDPGYEASGRTLRKSAAHTISQFEQDTNPDPKLGAFFADCAAKTGGGSTDPLKALVSNGAAVPVKNSAGAAAGANATITVAASAVTGVKLPATTAAVVTGATVNVKNSTGAISKAATATVAAGVITGVALPATMTIVENGGAVVLTNSAGTDIPGAHTRLVENGAQPSIKLAPSVAAVTSGLSTVAATGTGTKVTFTVANGVITAITLSA